MNLRNMPEEEELDHLFRQAADSYQPEFDPEAWREMEKKLDAANKPPLVLRKWIKRTLLLLLVFLSGWVVYRYAPRETDPNNTVNYTTQPGSPALVKTPRLKITGDSAINNKELLAASSGNKTLSNDLPAAKEQANESIRLQRRSGNRVLTTSPKVVVAVHRGNNTRGGDKNLPPVPTNPEATGASRKVPTDSIKQEASSLQVIGTETEVVDTLALLPAAISPIADSANNPTAVTPGELAEIMAKKLDSTTQQVIADSTVKTPRAGFLSKLGVSLVLGPDFSTVRFVRPEKASTNVGVLFSYHINRRWAVSTGLVRARKVYGAKPEDYHPGANYWPPGQRLPDDINAICKVLDIPINVRYALVALPRQVIYVQTGLSSYVMLHEDYRYDYNKYGQPYSKHWIVTNENRHFFQVLNLSAGYSRQVKPGISVGAEPFIKIPLAGVGAGKVKLTSMGAFFTLGYRFR